MKVKSKTITGLKEEVGKLVTEKQTMNEELAQLQPLRQYASELDRLRKEFEERDIKLEELFRVKKESEKTPTSSQFWRG